MTDERTEIDVRESDGSGGKARQRASDSRSSIASDGRARRAFNVTGWLFGLVGLVIGVVGLFFNVILDWDEFITAVTTEAPNVQFLMSSDNIVQTPQLSVELNVTDLQPGQEVWMGVKDEEGTWWVEQANDIGNMRGPDGDVYQADMDVFDAATSEGEKVLLTAMVVDPPAAHSFGVYWGLVTAAANDYPDVWNIGYGRELPIEDVVAEDSRLVTYRPETDAS